MDKIAPEEFDKLPPEKRKDYMAYYCGEICPKCCEAWHRYNWKIS